MLLWASRAIRRIRSGNDVPEVLAEKWSELCLLGKQTGKMVFVWRFRTLVGSEATQKSRNGLSSGGLALPQHIPSQGTEGRG